MQLLAGSGVDVSESTVSCSLTQRGFLRKRIARNAQERCEDQRGNFLLEIGQCPPRTLVFVDESAYNRHVSHRTYGWAPIGSRARRCDMFVRGTR